MDWLNIIYMAPVLFFWKTIQEFAHSFAEGVKFKYFNPLKVGDRIFIRHDGLTEWEEAVVVKEGVPFPLLEPGGLYLVYRHNQGKVHRIPAGKMKSYDIKCEHRNDRFSKLAAKTFPGEAVI